MEQNERVRKRMNVSKSELATQAVTGLGLMKVSFGFSDVALQHTVLVLKRLNLRISRLELLL